jgi:hypothetical protein
MVYGLHGYMVYGKYGNMAFRLYNYKLMKSIGYGVQALRFWF